MPKPLIGDIKHYDNNIGVYNTGTKYGCQDANKNRSLGKIKYQFAFTLAEILITLSIIGVVGSLTIPSLIAKNQEKETVVKVKKIYTVLSDAYSLALIEYGNPALWNWVSKASPEGANQGMDKLGKYLNTIKRCNQNTGCFAPNVAYKTFDGTGITYADQRQDESKSILADGMSIGVHSYGNECQNVFGNTEILQLVCASIDVDVNGFKGPNVWGKDLFSFHITQKGIVPVGIPSSTTYSLEEKCRTHGAGCTAWVILKGNMDYPPQGVGWGD